MAYPENHSLLFAATMMTSVVDAEGKVLYKLPTRLAASLIEKYTISQKGKTLSKETKERMSNSRKGHKTSEETRKKISDSEKGKIVSRETSLKIIKSKNLTKNQREILSQTSKERMKDMTMREKIRNKLRDRGDKNKTHGIKINVDGVDYPSLSDCSKSLGISKFTLKKWISGEVYTKHIIKIEEVSSHYIIQGPDGTIYNSLFECSKLVGHSKKNDKKLDKKLSRTRV